jgi:hypothetical protein
MGSNQRVGGSLPPHPFNPGEGRLLLYTGIQYYRDLTHAVHDLAKAQALYLLKSVKDIFY